MDKISVIIPMYNEENIYNNLKETLSSLKKNFKNNFQIILVDDGSTDNSLKEAEKIKSKNLKILHYDENKGKGHALKYGFNFIKSEFVTFIDADLDLHPDQIKNFFDYIKDADIVIGSKRHPYSKVDYPLSRKILSRSYQLFIFFLFGLNVKDTQSGIKLFRYEALKKILPKVLVKKYAFDLELLVNAQKNNLRIKEAPITLNYNFNTSLNLNSVWYIFLDTLAIFYRLRILKYYD